MDYSGMAPGALPLPLEAVDDHAWSSRTPMRRLVAVEDDEAAVARAIRRHAAQGWKYVEPPSGTDAAHPLYFGMRMLSFRRA